MTIAISFGKWGGFYLSTSPILKRLCLGFVAIDVYTRELDCILEVGIEALEAALNDN